MVKYMKKYWIESFVEWTNKKYEGHHISEFSNAIKIETGKFDKDEFTVWKIDDEKVVTSRHSHGHILTCFC